jgi:hypothetical protein
MNQSPKVLLGIIFLILAGGFLFLNLNSEPEPVLEEAPDLLEETVPVAATSTSMIIGSSVQNRNIEAHSFGTGETDLLFVGGIHGGYEWNSILLAYEMIDYLHQNPNLIPENVTVHIIPNLNPDGLFAATALEGKFAAGDVPDNDMHISGLGRTNANDVDLNRNFACKWAPESTWRNKVVSAGQFAFSEPEAAALRDYVRDTEPKAAVFWHSRANNVYASECENGVLPETLTLMQTYSDATSYGAVPVFDAYPITGDAEGWLATLGIPAVTVELDTRTSIEWTNNLSGLKAVLALYSE